MLRIAPQWIVDNLEETINFYVHNLNFKVDWEGTLFSIVSKGGVTIMIRQLKRQNLKRPNRVPFVASGWHTPGQEAWDAYIWVDDVDELYLTTKERPIKIIKDIQNTDYGNREFEIEDNNGYILCFGKEIK